jgi:hypothetical protein
VSTTVPLPPTPLAPTAAQPVSTPPAALPPDQQRSANPATSAAIPVSAAPGGVTAMPVAGSDLVGPADELSSPFSQVPIQPTGPAADPADHAPVPAPPVSAPPVPAPPVPGPPVSAPVSGPPVSAPPVTSGPPAGGSSEVA